MAAIGIIVKLIVVGLVGGLVRIVLGLLGGSLFLLPVLLITLGIIWLVKGSNPRIAAGARAERGGPAPPHGTGSPR